MPPSTAAPASSAPPPVASSSPANSQLTNQQLASNPFGATPPPDPNSIGTILPPAKITFTAPNVPTTPVIDFSQYAGNPTGAATAFQNAQSQIANAQNAARSDIFSQYTNAINSFGSTANNYNQLATAYGVPAYQQTINNLQYAISHLKDDVSARTQGYNVNQAQNDELYNTELTPLSQNLSDVGREYNTATSNIDKLLQYQAQDQTTQLKPLEAYISSLDTSFANQNSAFDTAANAGLTSIQNQATNQLAQDTFNQNAKQFGLTYALDQQKQADSNAQFAQTFGLDQQKYQASVDQFNQTHTLQEQQLNQAAQQFAMTFGLDQLKNQEQVSQFAQTYGLDQQKFQEAANEFSANNTLALQQLAQKSTDDAAKNALYQAQIDKLTAQANNIGTASGNIADYLGNPSSPPPTPQDTSFASGLGNFAAGGYF